MNFFDIFKDKDEDKLEREWNDAIKEYGKELKQRKLERQKLLESIKEMDSTELLRVIAKILIEQHYSI